MAKPAVVKVVADAKSHDRTIENSARLLNNFGKNGISSLTSLAGAWGKLVPAIGAAVGAQELFSKALNSSQALGDTYNNTMGALSTTVDTFFSSLTSGDWSAFNQGISNVISKAYEAQVALDQLGNSVMSLGVVNARENLELQQQLTILRSAKKGSDEYNAALKAAQESVDRMNAATGVVQSDQWNAMRNQIASWSSLDAGSIQFDWVLDAQTLDASADRDALKKKAQDDVRIYNEELKKLNGEFYETKQVFSLDPADSVQGLKNGKTQEEYNRRVAELNALYGKSIVQVTLLDRKNDESLRGINDLTTAYYGNAAAIESKRTMLARLSKETATPTGGNGGNTERQRLDAQIQQSMLEQASNMDFWQLIQDNLDSRPFEIEVAVAPIDEESDLAETLNAQFQDTRALERYNQRVAELNEQMKMTAVTSMADAFQSLGGAIGGAAGNVLSLVGAMAQQVVQGVTTIASLQAQAAAAAADATAQTADASAKTLNAHAMIPFVGVAMGIGMVSSIIATLQNLPKFAQGAYADRPTLGIFGEAGPELVLPERKLDEAFERHQYGGIGGRVKFEIGERALTGWLDARDNRQKYN